MKLTPYLVENLDSWTLVFDGTGNHYRNVMISSSQPRETTLLPSIPGLLSLLVLTFTPKAEFRIDKGRRRYTGALCGLGTAFVLWLTTNQRRPLFNLDIWCMLIGFHTRECWNRELRRGVHNPQRSTVVSVKLCWLQRGNSIHLKSVAHRRNQHLV